jgi:hypothetical protein
MWIKILNDVNGLGEKMRICLARGKDNVLYVVENINLLCALHYQGISQVHVQKSGSHMTRQTGSVFVMVYDLSSVIFYVPI